MRADAPDLGNRNRPPVGEAGFTLAETIASLVLLGVIATFIYSFMFTAVDGYIFSTVNTQAAGELKPMLDYVSTRMSDMEEITCFATDLRIEFTDSDDNTVMVEITGGNTLTIDSWDILKDISNPALVMSSQDAHVDTVTLSFDVELADQTMKTYTMQFSPRAYIPTADVGGC